MAAMFGDYIRTPFGVTFLQCLLISVSQPKKVSSHKQSSSVYVLFLRSRVPAVPTHHQ